MTDTPLAIAGKSFEDLKQINEYGAGYWNARVLQPLLGYSQWRRFAPECTLLDSRLRALLSGIFHMRLLIRHGFKRLRALTRARHSFDRRNPKTYPPAQRAAIL
jgi:hypothetical protein